MVYQHWSEEMEVGVPEIDNQQRALLDGANRLFDALVDGQPYAQRLADLLADLDRTLQRVESIELQIRQRATDPELWSRPTSRQVFAGRLQALVASRSPVAEREMETLQLVADWMAYHQAWGLGACREAIRRWQRAKQAAAHPERLRQG